MNKYHAISYYSDVDPNISTYYEDNYKRLKAELDNNSIPYDIHNLKSKNNYMENCLRKPKFILDQIKKLNTPVLWMDIDCHIQQFPHEFIDNNYDICFSIREKRQNGEVVPESCFIYFNNTPSSISFIEDFVNHSEKATRDLDHLILIDLYNYYIKEKNIKIKEFDWYYASPKHLPMVKILMGNSVSTDKRQAEFNIRRQGRL
jgi:hypothetical protein